MRLVGLMRSMRKPRYDAVHAWKLDVAKAYDRFWLRLNMAVRRLEPMALAILFRFAL